MTDITISALPVATVSAGTDVMPIVQSGVTKQLTNTRLFTNATLTTPRLGTPQSGTLTNCTGLPVASGISGLGANVATFLTTPTSANLAAAVTGDTGTGSLVFATSPTLATPTLTSPTMTAPALGTVASGVISACTSTGMVLTTPTITSPVITGSGTGSINGVPIGATTASTGKFTSLTTSLVTNAAATYTVLASDQIIIQTTTASTYTLPAPASFTGRQLHIVTQFAGAVISASANVFPLAGGSPGTAILAATAGKWATLVSNGTNWVIVASN